MNRIYDALDMACLTCQPAMIRGLTGSGKTAIVRQWLEEHPQYNGVWFDAADLVARTPSIDAKRRKKTDLTLIGQKFTADEIELMRKPDTIIVVDNYHLLDNETKSHVLLLCDRFVVDESEEYPFVELPDVITVCAIATDCCE